jgi:hypothetical protein
MVPISEFMWSLLLLGAIGSVVIGVASAIWKWISGK